MTPALPVEQPASEPTAADRTDADGWLGELSLGFERRGAASVLAMRRHRGPLTVQRPFYPEGPAVCQVTLLHPPGGVVGGDRLHLTATLDPGAQALITTPAAAKIYRSAGPIAAQRQDFQIATGAALEWLPQETILYSGARVRSCTRVELAPGARFLGWEITCLGRPHCAERFEAGVGTIALELWEAGEPLFIERGRYAGGGDLLTAPWGMAGHPVAGTWLALDPPAALTNEIRAALAQTADPTHWGLSRLPRVLVLRYRGPSAAEARALFIHAWTLARPVVLGREARPPRIWAT
ncbi:MAG TPA: urease accessory protein UreD [Candidatus Macondimonas sp.]|nr:urease accessory protein UreD [Candidatus Macondimonas sp.]